MPKEPMKFEEMLKDSPKNWGRWGANDELGCLNFLTMKRSCAASRRFGKARRSHSGSR